MNNAFFKAGVVSRTPDSPRNFRLAYIRFRVLAPKLRAGRSGDAFVSAQAQEGFT
jgi:hypothetical protein